MNGADGYRGLRAAASPPGAHGARSASLAGAGAGAARGVCRLRWTQAGPRRAEESARGRSWRGGGRRPIPLGFVRSLRAGRPPAGADFRGAESCLRLSGDGVAPGQCPQRRRALSRLTRNREGREAPAGWEARGALSTNRAVRGRAPGCVPGAPREGSGSEQQVQPAATPGTCETTCRGSESVRRGEGSLHPQGCTGRSLLPGSGGSAGGGAWTRGALRSPDNRPGPGRSRSGSGPCPLSGGPVQKDGATRHGRPGACPSGRLSLRNSRSACQGLGPPAPRRAFPPRPAPFAGATRAPPARHGAGGREPQ